MSYEKLKINHSTCIIILFLDATNREPSAAEVVIHDSIANFEVQEARVSTIYGARPVVTVDITITNVDRTITAVAVAC